MCSQKISTDIQPIHKNTIFIIDDDQDNIKLLKKILTRDNYIVLGATDPFDAVQTVISAPPDLIILDISMPDMNGFEACQILKKSPRTMHVPVIFISGLNNEDDKVMAFEAGGVDYINKPYMPGEVRARVKTHLTLQRSQQELKALNIELDQCFQLRTKELETLNLTFQEQQTDQKQAEKALRNSEKLYRTLTAASPAGIYLTDTQGKCLFVNERWTEMAGISQDEALGEGWKTAIHPDDFDRFYSWWDEFARTKSDWGVEYRFLTPEGKTTWVYSIASPVVDIDGNISGSVGFNTDITARRQAEMALQASEERFRAIADYTYDWETWIGQDGSLIWTNPAVERVTGYTIEEYRSISDDYTTRHKHIVFGEEQERIINLLVEGLKHKKSVNDIEFRVKKKDGTALWCSLSFQPIYGLSGSYLGLRCSYRDISLRKKMEEEALSQQQQLIQADRLISLGILVSGIAHEINNPNHFIITHLNPLKKSWEGIMPIVDRYYKENGDFKAGGLMYSQLRDKIPEIFANIAGGSKRIKSIVDELRDYARDRPADFTTTIKINNIVKSALILLANLLKKSTNNLDIIYGKDLPLVKGDYHRLEQVIVNLIQNSCQALPDKNAAITIETTYDHNIREILVIITDQGRGIEQDNLSHIQDPFFSTKRDQGGMGLGLSISASIIAEHSGRMEFDSSPGQGTISTIFLPVLSEDGSGFIDRRKSDRKT